MQKYYRNNKNYIKICKDSGCISAYYNTKEEYGDKITLITSDVIETSGSFVIHRNNH